MEGGSCVHNQISVPRLHLQNPEFEADQLFVFVCHAQPWVSSLFIFTQDIWLLLSLPGRVFIDSRLPEDKQSFVGSIKMEGIVSLCPEPEAG